MSLEASVSFFCFLFFVVNVFSFIFLFIQYGERLGKLQQQGKELAAYAYAAGEGVGGSDEMICLKEAEAVDSPLPFLAGFYVFIYAAARKVVTAVRFYIYT